LEKNWMSKKRGAPNGSPLFHAMFNIYLMQHVERNELLSQKRAQHSITDIGHET